MPTYRQRLGRATALAVACAGIAFGAAAQTPEHKEKVENSDLSGPLFQQLLIGEIEAREGELGTAYQLILNAARQTRDERLFRRATELALQGRAGDEALAAVRAWREALPKSSEALRTQVQLLVQMKRTADVVEPLDTLLKVTPAEERTSTFAALPLLLARNADKAQTARLIEKALLPYADAPDTRVAARVGIGRGWLGATDTTRALALARSAHEMDRGAEAPALLALELLPSTGEAEPLVQDHLNVKPDSNGVRLLYVRDLLAAQRLSEATKQLDTLTHNSPKMPQAWLTLGALHLQLHNPEAAAEALQTYIGLVKDSDQPAADLGSDDGGPLSKEDALDRGWLLLAQAAEQRNDRKAADEALSHVTNPQRAVEVQTRRASLLAREGHVAQARELIQRLPEKTEDEARAKVFAEAQVLREAKLWSDANAVLAKGNKRFVDDPEMLYEQSMMLERLNQLADMERLLRRVMVLKPEFGQAYNALGYSLADRNQRLPEARTLIAKALELSPGDPSITDSLGWVEFRLGHFDEAVRLLREAYKGQPDAEIAAHLGEVLWSHGEPDAARKVWAEGKQRDADNEVLRETLTRLKVRL